MLKSKTDTTQVSFDQLPQLVATLINEVANLRDSIQTKPQPTESEGKILTGSELRQYLNISKTTETRWRRSGKLPYFSAGGYFRYNSKEVLNALSSNKK